MPNRDGTGPLGQGAKTGRNLGNCDNNSSTNSNQTLFGRFCGWCFGAGRGRGRNRRANAQNNGLGYNNQKGNIRNTQAD